MCGQATTLTSPFAVLANHGACDSIAPMATGPFDPAPFRLEEYLGIWEFQGEHYLTASDAETLTVEELLAYADPDQREAFARLPLSYAPTWGGEQLRTAIADLYDGLGPEHVLTFAGAEEALFWVLQELVGPGDHALGVGCLPDRRAGQGKGVPPLQGE